MDERRKDVGGSKMSVEISETDLICTVVSTENNKTKLKWSLAVWGLFVNIFSTTASLFPIAKADIGKEYPLCR